MNNRNRSRCSIAIVIFVLSPPAVAQECPEFVGSVDIDRPGVPWAIAVSDGYAYVAAGTDGLRVIDVRVPSAPVEVGSLDTPGDARNLAVSGNHVFVADGDSRSVRVIDVTSPSAPVEVGFHHTAGTLEPEGIAVAGDYAYVVAWEGSIPVLGLDVIDVSSPSAPFQVGGLGWVGAGRGIVVSGDYAYVAGVWWVGGGSGLNVIDISSPSLPVERGFCEVPAAWEVAVSDGHAYVVPGVGGVGDGHNLTVIDVDNPEMPTEVGLHDLGPRLAPKNVAVSETHAYVPAWEGSQGISSLRVIDVGTPSAPVEVGFADTAGYPFGVAVSAGYVYAVFGDATSMHMDIFRDCASVFLDGFESGDTSAWSVTLP